MMEAKRNLVAAWAAAFLLSVTATTSVVGQVILNEANAVGISSFVQTDETFGESKPYEGYDYGIIPHSGNNNSPIALVNPGNPFAADLDSALGGGIQTSLPGGWDLISNPTGFGRIQNNGGDWFEIVITDDHTDLRGYTFYWENDDNLDTIVGDGPDERGFIKLLDNKAFADMRAGTIITMSEDQIVAEVRDKFPNDDEFNLGGPDPHDTGYRYDLSTDTSFNPYTSDDWHVHFHVDESLTDLGLDTPYFAGYSDMKVDNDRWLLGIYDSTNTAIQAEAELPGTISDLITGQVMALVGEDTQPGVSVNNQELFTLRSDPGSGLFEYEDVDFSTFGRPNYYNDASETTLDGYQNFDLVRNPVLANTYDWNVGGAANFADAGNWINPSTSSVPGTGPTSAWTVRVVNNGGTAAVAQISTTVSAGFVSVMSNNAGSMTLQVTSAGSLEVSTGRVLVMDGGTLNVDGSVTAVTTEAFSGGTISGSGQISGELVNSGGTINPGSSAGTLTVNGDFLQNAEGTLLIELAGLGQSDRLNVFGTARAAGEIQVALSGGYTPTAGDVFVVLKADELIDDGYALTGAGGFNAYTISDAVLLSFQGMNPDFNQDNVLNCSDVDALVAAIVNTPTNLLYDVSGDGTVSASDLTTWLAAAGAVNLASGNSYLVGDANLDGVVDGQDFIRWNTNKFTSLASYCSGDFNADGVIDGQDFIRWNTNKFTSAAAAGTAVPEPSSMGLMLVMSALLFVASRSQRQAAFV